MKHLIYVLPCLMVIGLSRPAIAQLSLGVRAAANLSNVHMEYDGETEDTDHLFGIAVGLAAEYGISNMFAIQPELLYSQHGTLTTIIDMYVLAGNVYKDSYVDEIRYSYLQIPILAKLNLGSERVRFHILAGPHVGFGIGKVEIDSEITHTINDVIDAQFNDSSKETWEDVSFKTFDFGLTGGVGIGIPAGPGTLSVDARYQFGLVNFSDFSDETLMNRNIQFGLSYLLPLGM